MAVPCYAQEKMESEKTRLRVAEQTQKVVVKEAETAKVTLSPSSHARAPTPCVV